ncbi:putative signal peptide protein [Puccinia sorghi]|uniref:Putative signal peptide protein n=1 Tax=Puccinia sorghi TaxID=27349 RepID=A0A0L6VPM8_9BASI|nr:putative signal peptide protein [Puccinia sorghi]
MLIIKIFLTLLHSHSFSWMLNIHLLGPVISIGITMNKCVLPLNEDMDTVNNYNAQNLQHMRGCPSQMNQYQDISQIDLIGYSSTRPPSQDISSNIPMIQINKISNRLITQPQIHQITSSLIPPPHPIWGSRTQYPLWGNSCQVPEGVTRSLHPQHFQLAGHTAWASSERVALAPNLPSLTLQFFPSQLHLELRSLAFPRPSPASQPPASNPTQASLAPTPPNFGSALRFHFPAPDLCDRARLLALGNSTSASKTQPTPSSTHKPPLASQEAAANVPDPDHKDEDTGIQNVIAAPSAGEDDMAHSLMRWMNCITNFKEISTNWRCGNSKRPVHTEGPQDGTKSEILIHIQIQRSKQP